MLAINNNVLALLFGKYVKIISILWWKQEKL